MRKTGIYLIVVLFISYGCNKPQSKESSVGTSSNVDVKSDANPALPGFNAVESDEKAVEIADAVMKSMGGRTAWDNMKTLSWNFFGARKLIWDKPSGNVKIDVLNSPDSIKISLNLNDTTKMSLEMKGEKVNHPDSLSKFRRFGNSVWINDAYWVVMPFKLKDSGVTLNYIREDTTLVGESAHVLQLTFAGVGDTPQNKYEIYVSKERSLVAQWAYFRDTNQEQANFNLPWDDYKDYNGLLLATERGNRDITELKVTDAPGPGVFSF